MKNKIRAVLFDMDGLMFDTERMCENIWIEVGQRHNMPITPEVVGMLRGRNRADGRRAFLQHFGEDAPYDELSAEMREEMNRRLDLGIPLRPGLFALLDTLQAHGIPMALASSTSRARVLLNLENSGTAKYFSAVICGDMVPHSKPEPEIFLKAAEMLGVPPAECMVLEDSFNGVRAGAAAGCFTVMVPDLDLPTPEMEALADRIVSGLSDVTALFA